MRDRPLVSIGIPTWNYGEYLGECIESVLAQTYENIEVIICDNASTDSTPEVVRRYEDPRIRYYRNEANIGLYPNWNLCLRYAKGKYFKILQSDDKLSPNFIEECLDIFMSDSNVIMVVTSYVNINSNGIVYDPRRSYSHEVLYFSGSEKIASFEKFSHVQPTFNIYVRDLALDVGGYQPENAYSADFIFWCKMIPKGDVAYIDKPLAYQRIHDRQDRRKFDGSRFLEDWLCGIDFLVKYYGRSYVSCELKRKLASKWGEHFLWHGLKHLAYGNTAVLEKVVLTLKEHQVIRYALVRFIADSPIYLTRYLYNKLRHKFGYKI